MTSVQNSASIDPFRVSRNGLFFDLHMRLYNIQPRRAWEAYRLLLSERGRADRGSAKRAETRSFGKIPVLYDGFNRLE